MIVLYKGVCYDVGQGINSDEATVISPSYGRGGYLSSYFSESKVDISAIVPYDGVNYTVTKIGNAVFRGCSNLVSVTIPNSVVEIEDDAFENCSSLTSIIIPDSVTTIGSNAFFGCTCLATITFPACLAKMGHFPFDNTAWLGNQPDGVIYVANFLYAYKGAMPAGTSLSIRQGTTHIAFRAFFGCSGLTSITIPEGVIEIGAGSFESCTGLTTVTIPDSVEQICGCAFRGCSSLNTVNFSENSKLVVIKEHAFNGCYSLLSICIPDGVEEICFGAFRDCNGMTTLVLPKKLKQIGSKAFANCTSLQEVYCRQNKLRPINPNIIFDGVLINKVTLHVRKNINNIFADGWWENFGIIKKTFK